MVFEIIKRCVLFFARLSSDPFHLIHEPYTTYKGERTQKEKRIAKAVIVVQMANSAFLKFLTFLVQKDPLHSESNDKGIDA